MANWIHRGGRVLKTALLVGMVVVCAGSGTWYAQSQMVGNTPEKAPEKTDTAKAETIVRLDLNRLTVPEAVADRMHLKTVALVRSQQPVTLPSFPGCLALDSNRLQRVHTRFAGEVVELGKTDGPSPRPLQVGDSVVEGQLLVVVWSKDLGEKKSELVDAISRLKADERVFTNLKQLFDGNGGVPERSVRDAERAVDADRIAVDRAERTLKTWKLTDRELADVRAEAERLRDEAMRKKSADSWARVDVRATANGTILEKGITSVGDIVDTATDLFKIGDLSKLSVWAHVYEEDLPLVNELPKPLAWTVTLPSRPGFSCKGTLEQVGNVIDPNQHTALVTGCVANPTGELKIGQFVTLTVERPATSSEWTVPVDAVVEDGRESFVFERVGTSKTEFVRKSVHVIRRNRDSIAISTDSGLRETAQLVTSGSLLLREAMDALPVPSDAVAVK